MLKQNKLLFSISEIVVYLLTLLYYFFFKMRNTDAISIVSKIRKNDLIIFHKVLLKIFICRFCKKFQKNCKSFNQ